MVCNFVKARENKECLIDLLKKISDEEIASLLFMIKPKMKEILISSHKFCQKFFERLSPEERIFVLKEAQPFFLQISLNKWGSISLQSLVKLISLPEEEDTILLCIQGKICEMICNKYSNFVIQKIVPVINERKLPFIIKEIFFNFIRIVNCNIGLSFIKNIMLTIKSPEIKMFFVKEILSISNFVLLDIKASNVLAFAAEKFDSECKITIISTLIQNYGPYFLGNYSYLCLVKSIRVSDYKYLKYFYPSIFFSKNFFIQLCATMQGQFVLMEFFKKLNNHKREDIFSYILTFCDNNFTQNNISFLKDLL